MGNSSTPVRLPPAPAVWTRHRHLLVQLPAALEPRAGRGRPHAGDACVLRFYLTAFNLLLLWICR